MSQLNAKIGIALLVVVVAMVAIVTVLYINNEQALYRNMEMDVLTKKVEGNNLSFNIGFKEYDEQAVAHINVIIDKIAIKDRMEATYEQTLNESYTKTINAPVDVIKFTNITKVHKAWTYRIHITCTLPSHGEIRDEEFYIFADN